MRWFFVIGIVALTVQHSVALPVTQEKKPTEDKETEDNDLVTIL